MLQPIVLESQSIIQLLLLIVVQIMESLMILMDDVDLAQVQVSFGSYIVNIRPIIDIKTKGTKQFSNLKVPRL